MHEICVGENARFEHLLYGIIYCVLLFTDFAIVLACRVFVILAHNTRKDEMKEVLLP